VRSGDLSGTAHLSDDLPLRHSLTLTRKVLPIVCVDRYISTRMANDHDVPVSAQFVAEKDRAFLNGPDWSPLGC